MDIQSMTLISMSDVVTDVASDCAEINTLPFTDQKLNEGILVFSICKELFPLRWDFLVFVVNAECLFPTIATTRPLGIFHADSWVCVGDKVHPIAFQLLHQLDESSQYSIGEFVKTRNCMSHAMQKAHTIDDEGTIIRQC